ncbi:threonine--tRNA ligase [Candidatus Gottesmanbacteria bacterium]|nr:threonine--tRNA ligase [Candidatus Gottesmanbacteria bacterium]
MDNLRHSCAHLLAAAVMQLWPNTKRTIGPAIENGFYFDFDFGKVKINDEDLPKIEKKMRQILPTWKGFERHELSTQDAKKEYPGNEFKEELIDEFTKDGQKLSFYKSGDYWDLCKGGHVENPDKVLGNFKLLSIAGAYWRGSEKNKMLTRIYGTVFPTKEELDKYLWQLEEAKKRDHKKLGPKLELFMFDPYSPGMPYWLPHGVIVLNELVNFWRVEHNKRGYQEIKTPLINKRELYETSGHWDHYRENMFLSETSEKEIYGLKPMNCPNAMVVFAKKSRSYRELPLRLSDTDTLHRYERSGTLNGLFRVREFSQDDAHIFVSENQIKDEYMRIFEITELFYSVFNMEYSYRLGTRPEKFMGDKKVWDRAEKELKAILDKSGKKYTVLAGDGAFYGPKIDILMKDFLGREWQMGTIQLDFQIPKRFGLAYQAADGTLKTPVVIHRVIYGSLERFIGILIEHSAGNFPDWLSPVQITLIPIAERHNDYVKKIQDELLKNGVRVNVDDRAERMQARIRDATLQKVPYIGIIGDREARNEAFSFSLRNIKGEDKGIITIDEFISKILKKAVSAKG